VPRDGATGAGAGAAVARGAGAPAASRSTRSTSSAKGTSRLIWTIFRSASSRVTADPGPSAVRLQLREHLEDAEQVLLGVSLRQRTQALRSSGTSDASNALASGAVLRSRISRKCRISSRAKLRWSAP